MVAMVAMAVEAVETEEEEVMAVESKVSAAVAVAMDLAEVAMRKRQPIPRGMQ